VTSRVVAVVNQKGGAGKTTLAMNLAAGLMRRGETIVIDLDPQASAIQWASQGNRPFPAPVKRLSGRWDARTLHDDYRAYRHIVLDCPPAVDSHATQQALRAAQLALVPILPSPVDLWASLRLAQEIDAARRDNPRLAAYVVLNQIEPKSALSAAMHEALAEFDLPVLKSCLRRRAIYRNAAVDGRSVYDLGSRAASAVAEIEAIIAEVFVP